VSGGLSTSTVSRAGRWGLGVDVAVMGDASAVAWSDELRRTGRVVFTLRPRPVLTMLPLLWLWVGGQLFTLEKTLEVGGSRLVTMVLIFGSVLAMTGWNIWRLITRYPVLTVDHHGIRVRRKFLPWAEVGAIGLPGGTRRYRRLPIIPKDAWGKDLTIDQSAVRDIPALARWLEELVKEQRSGLR
jgi:hypothetical protein